MTPRTALVSAALLGALSLSGTLVGCASIAPGAHGRASASAPPSMGPAALEVAPARAPDSAVAPLDAPAPVAKATGFTDVNTDNSLVSNGSVEAMSEQLLSTASGFRREVYRLGGRVVSEQVHFHTDESGEPTDATSATYRIKILPRLLPDVLDWLGKHATITGQDVSSIVAMESESDAAVVRADVQARVTEIDARLATTDLDPAVRGALEEERRKLIPEVIANPDAVADNTKRVAVLELRLAAPPKLDPYAHGKMLAHARASVLGIGGMGGAHDRFGGGVGIGGRSPVSTIEVMAYTAPEMGERAGVSATLGFGSYSKAFGAGNRSTLNPYVGARIGYAYLDASYLAIAAEVGVEIVKERGIVWSVSARPMGLVGTDSHAAVEVGSSVGLAF